MSLDAAIFSTLKLAALKRICMELGVDCSRLRTKKSLTDALAEMGGGGAPEALLAHLTEPEIGQICKACGVPTIFSGAELVEVLARRAGGFDANRPVGAAPGEPTRFVAIDFETADYGRDSACSVALVRVENDGIVDRTHFLIRPPRRNFIFTYLHRISWRQVAREPSFSELWPAIAERLEGVRFLAAHNASFDRTVLAACCDGAGVEAPPLPYQCTVRLSRSTWNVHPTTLPDVCRFLDIPLRHHDALSDAEACARIVIEARRHFLQS